ncbi:Alkaline ceramidase [Dillenia turbinata]|uniref:Alkaline ceramidase n=1 Tax=Dillenia turbinata TaxID=194707 RepID=A0AAN8UF70_9MAGN
MPSDNAYNKVMRRQWFGNAPLYLCPLLARLALLKHNAYLPVPLWWVCCLPLAVAFQNCLQGTLCSLCFLCIPWMYKYYIYTEDILAKRLARLYFGSYILASHCWIFDWLFCKHISRWYFNPQGHAMWHVLMGFGTYFANAFLMFCRAQQLGWNPKIVYLVGFFPYVHIQKPKTQ